MNNEYTEEISLYDTFIKMYNPFSFLKTKKSQFSLPSAILAFFMYS